MLLFFTPHIQFKFHHFVLWVNPALSRIQSILTYIDLELVAYQI